MRAQRDLDLAAGQRRPEAAVGTEPERHVPVRVAVEHHLVGAVEHRLVAVARAPTRAARGRPRRSGSRRPRRRAWRSAPARTAGRSKRRNSSTAVVHQVRFVDQALAGVAVAVEVEQGAADRRAGGVEPTLHREHHHLLHGVIGHRLAERPRVEEVADHVVARRLPALPDRLLDRADDPAELLEHAVPRRVVLAEEHGLVHRLGVAAPVVDRQPELVQRHHHRHRVGEVVDDVDLAALDELVDAVVGVVLDRPAPAARPPAGRTAAA